ncbi:MAG: hypothetical protein ACRD50_12110 [Candidatus Acidiferrales bacterium]
MNRKWMVLVGFLALAAVAKGDTRTDKPKSDQPTLHLMSNSEFTLYLDRLEFDLSAAQNQIGAMDFNGLGLSGQDKKDIEQGRALCLEAIEHSHSEVARLREKQTLKFDFLLLVDLNELVRDFDRLESDLANPASPRSAEQKASLGYARKVLELDKAMAPRLAEFEQHVLAFAGVMDAAFDNADQNPARGGTAQP